MVRYADGPTTSVAIEVAASPEQVWRVISDPEFPARHSRELQEAGWDPDGPEPGLGARILGRNSHPRVGEWTTTSHVVEWEENAVFGWAVVDADNPSASWWFELAPTEQGTTVTQRVRLGPAPSGLTPAIEAMPDREEDIVAGRLKEHEGNMMANLEAIKSQLESSPQS